MSNISIRSVRKSYARNEVVHGVDLEIAQGEFVVILGPSGCGKSTLLRMVAGLETISSGEIAIGGTVVNKLEPRERGCAMVFQNYALYPHMTVAENIGYSLRIAGLAKAERMAKIRSVAQSLNITEFLERKPGQLSGGQRQRVAMGRAMIREPKVFLYDEPLSNLDAKLRVAMRIEIRRLQQRLGTTTLFVTHDQVEAMTLADRIVVMNKGTIEQVGTPREVYAAPASTYVAGFIGAPGMNLLKGVADPANAVVQLGDGQIISYDRQRWPQLATGEVTVGFRAEAAQMRSSPSGIEATLQFSEELGASHLLHFQVGGNAIVIAQLGDHRLASFGDRKRIWIDPKGVQFFNPETGCRLCKERGQTHGSKAAAQSHAA
jgi:sn-glycerol 3-phosphate transport system ATP-binding protein